MYPRSSTLTNAQKTRGNKLSAVTILSVLVFLLSGMPKLRAAIGAPLYAVDFIILYLLMKTPGRIRLRYGGYGNIIVQLLGCYLFFMVLGELHGALIYNNPFESIYMLFRCCMAISLARIIPQQVRDLEDLKMLLKGLCIGLLLSAAISILYSLPFSRGLTEVIFSLKMIAPNSDKILEGSTYYEEVYQGSYRGMTLIGASTFSSGVMALLWPLMFMGAKLLRFDRIWNRLSQAALFMLPLGILATYGRTAWLSVILVTVSTLLWGSKRGRLMLLFWLLVGGLFIGQIGTEAIASKLPLLNRVVSKTEVVIESGAENESEAERFLAYVEPFTHVTKYPSFFLAGSGIAQRKWQGNAFEEADTASHAVPAMAYYAYGVGGVVCQIGLMLSAFCTIYHRLHQAQRNLPSMVWIWRSLLAAWCGVLPWWCFGHGIVTQPRGAMFFFFYFGILLACERIYMKACWFRRQQKMREVEGGI